MFPEHLINALPENDDKEAALIMCDYIIEADQKHKAVVITKSLFDDRLRAITQFRAFCDPYELLYRFPSLNGDINKDFLSIHQFFVDIKEKIETNA
ncbi:MAG: hypothetical protein GY919_00320 [Photobacterium aquimaris]|nr:hypothetical protein [Photobacterium aquimaris]